jgi:hypothetical protein
LPRDPDKFDGDVDAQREFRERGIPSGLANEVFLDVYERLASFEAYEKKLERRLFDAYAAEVARVDQNHDGIISASPRALTPFGWLHRQYAVVPAPDGVQPLRGHPGDQ